IDRPSWADVTRSGVIEGLANLRDERAVPHVVARSRYGYSTRGRRAAIVAIPKLASDRKARETLEDLLDEADPYLRADAVRARARRQGGDARARRATAAAARGARGRARGGQPRPQGRGARRRPARPRGDGRDARRARGIGRRDRRAREQRRVRRVRALRAAGL